MNRVIHFEIGADDPERASKFYHTVFGWAINKWAGDQPYWLATTGPSDEHGINGAITARMHPQMSTVNSIEVASVDDTERRVVESGGTIMMPKTAVHGVGWIAYCADTEGNVFCLHQSDPTAK